MMTATYQIDTPATGIEQSDDVPGPTDEQMAQEEQARQAFLDAVSPHLAALPGAPKHRFGNVSKVEPFGGDTWADMNRYLLVLTVDLGAPPIPFDSFLPPGSTVTEVGVYAPMAQWPDGAQD
ncbi:hypothetical protein ACH4E7_36615 [Kitasatospora sp. NPDC018058]|uniref:hypothetical protein n=1 Tax=Kitasatospora sp. NPDC018058 TaxID=3364025 RepID=UPI0037BF6198